MDEFDELVSVSENAQSTATTKPIPNVFPTVTNLPYRLAIIGDNTTPDDVSYNRPFSGSAGREFDKILDRAKILRDACFLGSICQHAPSGNKLANLSWDGVEIQSGIEKLSYDLNQFKPNLIWCLGPAALHVFKCGALDVPPKRKTKLGPIFAYPNSLSDWRGSLFSSHLESPYPNCKTVASFHPSSAVTDYTKIPLILLDATCKVQKESLSPELTLPTRRLLVHLTFDELLSEIRKIRTEKPCVSVDIEGGVGTMSCLSLATSPSFAFIIPFTTASGNSFWPFHEEVYIWRELSGLLGDPSIPKVLQNSLYDRFVLQYSYGISVRGVVDDTMLKHWELYSELEKGLGFLCSIYTNEPFYKSERHSDSLKTFHEYCCKDSATTLEISNKLSSWIRGRSLDHYRFNMDLLNPLLYMELRGILYDTPLAKDRLKEAQTNVHELQYSLDTLSGRGITTTDKTVLRALVRDTMCYKRDTSQVKAKYLSDYDPIMRILHGDGPLSKAQLGRIATALGLGLNIKSPSFKTFIYTDLNLPPIYDKKTKTLTTDNEALLQLQKKATNERQKECLDLAISLAELRTRQQMLAIHADSDGRIRCGYNIVGTETGRITCYTSPTGSGYNLQTIPDTNSLRPVGHPLHKGMRDLFTADPGRYLFQCDLSGADGWTVGAHLYSLGEPTMLDDLRAKIKPAAAIAYMLRHGNESLKRKSRDEVKELLREIKKDDYDYFMCKCGIWGICYLMGVDRLSDLIFTQSEGKLILSRNDVKNFRDSVFARYHPDRWHKATQDKLSRQPYPPKLISASGHTRMFFGRYNEILGQALANEPQENTTYATNLAAYRLWNDPENRMGKKLKIEPLHQVHDALVGQFPISDTIWAVNKIKSYFNNPLIIAGIPITIPFSGSYGANWAMDGTSKVGEI